MNSYIDIRRNENIRREKAMRGVYALTEAGAMLVCAILNIFNAVVSVFSNDAVRLVIRGICVCVAAFVLIGSVGACENGSITLMQCVIRVACTCAACLGLFRLFAEE